MIEYFIDDVHTHIHVSRQFGIRGRLGRIYTLATFIYLLAFSLNFIQKIKNKKFKSQKNTAFTSLGTC